MATLILRATRSALSETTATSIHASNSLTRGIARSAASNSPRIATQPQHLARPFTSKSKSHQAASPTSAPTPSYPRKTNNNTTAKNASTSSPAAATPSAKPPSIDDQSPIKDMTGGLADEPLVLDEGVRQVDWTRSFHGLSSQPFSKEAADVLLAPIPFDDVEVKPDGIIYLPEIKYRRILNRSFGPGGWGLAPRGETIVTGKSITREYALVAHGR